MPSVAMSGAGAEEEAEEEETRPPSPLPFPQLPRPRLGPQSGAASYNKAGDGGCTAGWTDGRTDSRLASSRLPSPGSARPAPPGGGRLPACPPARPPLGGQGGRPPRLGVCPGMPKGEPRQVASRLGVLPGRAEGKGRVGREQRGWIAMAGRERRGETGRKVAVKVGGWLGQEN